MKKNQLTKLAAAAALALSFGSVIAQTGSTGAGGAAGATGSGSTGATGATAPAVQAGTGTRNSPNDSKTTKLDRADRKFILKAAEDGMYEVEIAKLATTKATSQEVKSFASTMVDDHTKSNSELAQLANSKGVELPAGPDHGKRRDLEKMGKLSGDKFDKKFVHEVGLEDHKKDIKEFEKVSKNAKDADVKAFAEKTLPTLRAHLAAAEKLPQNGKRKS